MTDDDADALFAAGCDDATPSVCYGRVWLDFARAAPSYKDAVLSAIRDVRSAGIGADVWRIDGCGPVTQAEIARRVGKSPQYLHQLMSGRRGSGGFPPPLGHLSEKTLLWQWPDVSVWLCENNVIKPEVMEEARIGHAINSVLDRTRESSADTELTKDVERSIAPVPALPTT